MNEKNIRKSNFELMRIVSMIFIIIFHILLHSNVLSNSKGAVYLLLVLLEAFVIVHVNSFIIVTGYFQCFNKARLSKFLSINNAVWFYKVVFTIIFVAMGLDVVNKFEFLKSISPINYSDYWFIGLYLILYLLSPVINKLIECLNKKSFQKLLILLFLVFSVLSTFTRQVAYNNMRGYSLGNFIFLYLIGAYLRIYPVDKSVLFKNIRPNMRKVLFFFCYFSLALLNVVIFYFGTDLLNTENSIFNEFGYIIKESFSSFCSPIVILQTIFFFLYFSSLDIKSKYINKIASCTFGIYLVHENVHLQNLIYEPLGFMKTSYSYDVFLKIIISTFIIFIISFVIEFVRQVIFKFIYNRKISLRFRNRCKNYINSLGINVNW